ncbi:hypothetical protein MBLNU230_g0970t1 [Neophaeotheca triangularis]
MELQYSPCRSPGGAPHLLSPTHAHTQRRSVEGFPSIKQIRRSLDRSPSKPSRFTLYTAKSPSSSPTAPAPSSGLARAYSAPDANEPQTQSKFHVKRPSLARTASRRNSPITKASPPRSPLRRALSDNTSNVNSVPRRSTRALSGFDQENMDTSEDAHPVRSPRFDDPIKLDLFKARSDKSLKEQGAPAKSSPLKRSDGVMNLEAASFGSPRAKRRSLHGASSFGSDFNVFDQGFDGTRSEAAESFEDKERESNGRYSSTSPQTVPSASPHKRPFSLRKSTLQQRSGAGRARLFADSAPEGPSSPALSRARSRISLDGALPLRSPDMGSSSRRNTPTDPTALFPPPAQRQHHSAPKPHPLSHALTPSSSTSSITEDSSKQTQMPPGPTFAKPQESRQAPPVFSKSLPIGAMRPAQSHANADGSQESFATPAAYKMAKPLPAAFMSTGLISKRNRNMDVPPASFGSSMQMPDTPSKKAHVMITKSPAPSALGKTVQPPQHEFGSPTTPFNMRTYKVSPETFGKNVNIFGSRVGATQLTRRGSFVSLDGDEHNQSPTHRLEAKPSMEDLPPTPTKGSTTVRPQSKGKSNSLRSSLFGRRTSLGPDTFASPADEGDSKQEADKSKFHVPLQCLAAAGATIRRQSVLGADDVCFEATTPPNGPKTSQISPHTPQESFTPPDPSGLSISVDHRAPLLFGSSSNSYPPATPTGPRDSIFGSSAIPGMGQSNSASGFFGGDVDTSLTSRFNSVQTLGIGEFSQVYRVEKPLGAPSATWQRSTSSAGHVWAVKKSKRPYTGNRDREQKMREVNILNALRGHEHIIEFEASWESKNHLYIQTEFCENGNLKDFLTQTGFKGRLDDFRIWKVLLELTQGIKSIHDASYIHLDLKPANVLIDWEGVLKIADFGIASTWPAPPHLDGEGDREYIGPEVLSGRFDKPADIFSLGMIMLEIAGNIVLPDNGTSWQRLRAGDLSDLPSLTWSSETSLVRDESGDPVELLNGASADSLCMSHLGDDDDLSFLRPTAPKMERSQELVQAPNFMIDPADPEALDRVVQWMICPEPDQRPTVDQLLQAGGVQWVERRRRAGATVFEGNWGPADDVLNHEQDVEMLDI